MRTFHHFQSQDVVVALSVILTDVAECLLVDVVVTDFKLDVKGLAQSLTDLLVAGDGGLPAVEADASDDLVDAVDDVGNDDRSVLFGPNVGGEVLDHVGGDLPDAGERLDENLNGGCL